MGYKYIGGGFVPGVPAEDLTDEEARGFGDTLIEGTRAVYRRATPAEDQEINAERQRRAEAAEARQRRRAGIEDEPEPAQEPDMAPEADADTEGDD